MNEEEKLIEDQLKTLPETLQKAINAVLWKSAIKEIGLLNKLSLPQLETLERETMLVIYGFDNPKNYIDNLAREIPTDEETAITMAESANEKIFQVIAKQAASQTQTKPPAPEVAPHNLPMVEKGEVAHSVPHVETPVVKTAPEIKKEEKPIIMPVPDYRYAGKDPYRESLN